MNAGKRVIFWLSTTILGGVAGTAMAQAAPSAAPVVAVDQVQEVVVTAEKRRETVLNVPEAVTALNGALLQEQHSFRFEDFVQKAPGLTLIDSGPIGSQLVIRGLSTGYYGVNSQVATYLDETPYTSVGLFAASYAAAPNLDTFDMQRVEVLRGPQGTLYGASALAGLLKYVTNAPDPSAFASTVQAGVSSVTDGGIGYDLHGMVNIPVGNDAALRLIGYDNYNPGFIDDPSRNLKDINSSRTVGGRASLLYEPTPKFSIRLNALYQERSYNDYDDEDVEPDTLKPIYGSRTQERLIGQPGMATNQLYNITSTYDLGFAKLLSTTSYSQLHFHLLEDETNDYGAILSSILGGAYGTVLPYDQNNESVTQEIRLSSPQTGALQWQVGVYYTSQSAHELEALDPINATTKTAIFNYPINTGTFDIRSNYAEYAAFANVDYFFTPAFDISLGGRYSDNQQTFHEIALGIFGGNSDVANKSSQGDFTYSGDLRWHVTPDNMVYARVAEGFVPGGPNDVVPTVSGLPASYSSSTAVSYEAGLKSAFFNHHLTAEVALFYIDWRKIQLDAIIGGYSSITNGGSARSEGLEWNFEYTPLRGLTVGFNGAYTDAYLTDATPASVGGAAGSRLPSVPLWATTTSLEYRRPLVSSYSGFVGVDWHYSGSRYADFSANGPRQELPKYNLVDLRAGLESARWKFEVYVKNVGDEVVINYVQPETLTGGFGPQSAVINTPRTIGAAVTAKF